VSTAEQHRPTTVSSRHRLYEEVREVLAQRLDDPELSVDDVASEVFVSRRQVQRVMEDHDTTFRGELTTLRLQRAAELLDREPLTVREVARHVGYRQPAQFAKAFRRMHGLTPSAFRARGTGAGDLAAAA
jgi:AraC family transcriptional regulator of adaptative response / methylphosphotriester-DNA alkyltransferase methyltransferase